MFFLKMSYIETYVQPYLKQHRTCKKCRKFPAIPHEWAHRECIRCFRGMLDYENGPLYYSAQGYVDRFYIMETDQNFTLIGYYGPKEIWKCNCCKILLVFDMMFASYTRDALHFRARANHRCWATAPVHVAWR